MGSGSRADGDDPGDGRSARPPTIYDVAQAAGVSHQTVSRFLRGFEGIRPETRERVTAALDELGYRPNLTARSLKSGRSHRLGALTHDLSHVGPSRIAAGASVAAREAGYVLDLVAIDVHDARSIQESLNMLAQHSLAGVLALASTDEMLRAFRETWFGVPFHVHAEADDSGTRTSDVSGSGIPTLVAHLAELGHRDFVHIAGPADWSASRNRQRGFDAAMVRAGLRAAPPLIGDWSAGSAYDAIASLSELPDATAYLAANDQMALGAMLALKHRGLRVPADVSVVGIDDIPEAAYFDPPLTTLHIDFEARGRESVAALLAKIDGDSLPMPRVPPPALVVRASSGPARAPWS
jgi:LacI family transcriptional regulator